MMHNSELAQLTTKGGGSYMSSSPG